MAQLLKICDKSGDGELQLEEFELFFSIVLRDAHKKAQRDGRAVHVTRCAPLWVSPASGHPTIGPCQCIAALKTPARNRPGPDRGP